MGRNRKTDEQPGQSPLETVAAIDTPQLANVAANECTYPDNFEFFHDYKPEKSMQKPLPWRPGTEHIRNMFNVKFFRPEEHHQLNGTVGACYWRTVKKDLVINGLCIAELFVDESDPTSPWDPDGLIPYGQFVKTPDGRSCREGYLAIRPAQASPAEERIRARNSAESVKKRHQASGREIASAADAIAKQHYRQAPDSSPLVFSQLTSYDQEMRANLVTSGMWDGLKAGKT